MEPSLAVSIRKQCDPFVKDKRETPTPPFFREFRLAGAAFCAQLFGQQMLAIPQKGNELHGRPGLLMSYVETVTKKCQDTPPGWELEAVSGCHEVFQNILNYDQINCMAKEVTGVESLRANQRTRDPALC